MVPKSCTVGTSIKMCHCWRMLMLQFAWRLVSMIDIWHHCLEFAPEMPREWQPMYLQEI